MNKSEFEAKLASLPEEEPDELDNLIIADSSVQDDGTYVSLNDFRTLMDQY